MSSPAAFLVVIFLTELSFTSVRGDDVPVYSWLNLKATGQTLRHFDQLRAGHDSIPPHVLEVLRAQDEDFSISDGTPPGDANDISPACIEAVNQTFSKENLWSSYNAKLMLDAFGKPGSDILRGETKWWGSYGECQSVKEAHYCIVTGSMTAQPSIPIPAWHSPVPFELGVCMPRVCSEADINGMVIDEGFNSSSPLKPILSQYLIVSNTSVFCAREETFTSGNIVALLICCVLGVVVLVGTAADFVTSAFTTTSWKGPTILPTAGKDGRLLLNNEESSSEVKEGSGHSEQTPLLHKRQVQHANGDPLSTGSVQPSIAEGAQGELPLFFKFLVCFSILRNTRRLLDTSEAPGTISCLHGMRVLSITWVILGHTYFLLINVIGSILTVVPVGKRFTFQAVGNAFFSVDSFFFIGGVLVMYLAIKQLDANHGQFPLGKFYFHRFWRLTPSYMFVIMFYATLFHFFGSGPFWGAVQRDTSCQKYWWTNLLYINNFYPNAQHECLAWGWYLACDMQFYVFTPIIIIALYRLRLPGMGVIFAFLAASFVTTAVITDYYSIRIGDMLTMMNTPEGHINDYMNKIYFKPYARCAPYLVGLALGYILQRKQEFTMRGVPRVVKLFLVLIGWCVSAVLLLSTLYGLYGAAESSKLLGKTASIVYTTFSRFAWSLGLAWIVFACQHGYGGVINRILSAKFWIPLSRLSYNVYLVHMIVLEMYYMSMMQPIIYTDISITFVFLAAVVASFLVAYLVTVVVEIPFFEIEKLILKRKSR